jgi:hypothetical protein
VLKGRSPLGLDPSRTRSSFDGEVSVGPR